MNNIAKRNDIKDLEGMIRNHPLSISPDDPCFSLKHTFGDGLYIRDLTIPKDMLVIGKIHKKPTLNFLLKGEITVLTEDGVKRLKAPLYFISPAGSRKVGYTWEETVWINVHATKETDLEKIEEEVILKDYDNKFIDLHNEENKIMELKKERV